MISARLGHFLDRPLRSIAQKIRLSPNAITVAGFLLTVAAAALLPVEVRAGAMLIIAGGLFDALDGVIARVNGRVSHGGAFLDSLLDRFSDAFLFLGVAVFFIRAGDQLHAAIAVLALISAFGVSYARARAEGLGYDCSVGLMERTERMVVLVAGCLFPEILAVCLWVILLGSAVTVVQRTRHALLAMEGKR